MHRASAFTRFVLLAVAAAAMLAACGMPTPSAVTSVPAPATTVIVAPSPSPSPSPSPPATSAPASIPAKLVIRATGLGPCRQPWWSPCVYGIRVEGAGGYDYRGSFAWDPGPPPSGEMGMGTAGPVSSTGVAGDVPATLGPGTWTLSFRLYYGSDAVSFNPVPGGTPRYSWEDPFTAACSTDVAVDADVAAVEVRVAFKGAACKVTMTYGGMPRPSIPAG